MLWRKLGHKRDDVKREWRKVLNEELNVVYFSPNTILVMKSRGMMWAVHVVRMGERRGVYSALMGKPEERRPLGRPRHRLESNIKMDREVLCGVWAGSRWLKIETGGGHL